jgi:hypothetical protein
MSMHFELAKHFRDSLTRKALRYMFINIPAGGWCDSSVHLLAQGQR